MIPSEIDIASLSAEVNEDGVATTDPALDSAIQKVLGDASESGVTNVGVVVLDTAPRIRADTRDIATAVAEETGKTIVIRTPGGAGTHSMEYSRAELEVAQSRMLKHPDYVTGFETYVKNLEAHSNVPWNALNVGALVLVAAIIAVCAAAIRRQAHKVR
ncbi:DUF6676 family protein [Corynebacterium ulceribovis]|uniref:Rv1476 family membrane protein n=1 Tax=Corynebacterium ulceribovis TaxID=487732 RepID=UPI0003791084|nr:DUF6676 family protein [Corynebacterium ulceribovis]